ncbi:MULTISPECIES: Na+/H+ antiporter subunit E [unclassified Corynebacterium]|uniref:Na+/H+ antiporter subunit E n=1 Tax=unclassified Corynebacterium TaxID=2624378 RepID=UPI0029CA5FEC|nr:MULTISPECIES: Na+/H+ antiporter subunit E [unclassified Corynebacterium]WPF65884.1 Na+/H+ antiporter subunit E [Corynebacterium sp. 22KM0430]WPF68377.1 Na+/H+ antiporter subunit E [Corynebacterium sp. 21KM1197]
MYQGVRNRMRPLTLFWITLLWCGLMGEVTWANVIAGLLVGLGVILILPLPRLPIAHLPVEWKALFVFLGYWLKELFTSSFEVAALALRPRALPKTAIVQAPMRVNSELILTLATGLYNLQPGGCITDIDIANRMWTVHLVNASTPEDIERELAVIRALERSMIDIFEGR